MSKNKRLTLKDIEDHLRWQDREAMRTCYRMGAFWGGSVAVGALFLAITNMSGISFTVNSIFFLLAGFSFMAYCVYKQWKIKRGEQEKEVARNE